MMACIDLKLIFIGTAIFVLFYRTEVNHFSDEFAISANHPFSTTKSKLYKVVTSAHLLDKWVDCILFFMPADYKPLKVGKVFKAVLEGGIIVFNTTDWEEGNYLALESNFVLRPRVEIYFDEVPSNPDRQRKSNALSRLHVRLIFRRPSLLFQYTIGAVLRRFLYGELVRFLRNLEVVIMRI